MSSEFGKIVKVTLFGESHGEYVGTVVDGLPSGEKISLEELQIFLDRRKGADGYSTARKESDIPRILSGLKDGFTEGSPLAAIICNENARSDDYPQVLLRPGHADYTALVKYKGFADLRGGGHFSGRLTAPLCVGGGIAKQILARKGITVGGHIFSVGEVLDAPFDPVNVSAELLNRLEEKMFPVIDCLAEEKMKQAILCAKNQGDSVGGIAEIAVSGLPVGLGEPMFGGVESALSAVLFGIPAVKGVEFGLGFKAAAVKGSQNNDSPYYDGDTVKTLSNNSGGILGGVTNGMPLIVRVAFKPTPSIAKTQNTVDIEKHANAVVSVGGRHDPCIAVRAVPVVESAVALVILDLLVQAKN